MGKGIVVDNLESGVRYSISEENLDEKTEVKIRDLNPGETILGYTVKPVTTSSNTDVAVLPLEEPTEENTRPGI